MKIPARLERRRKVLKKLLTIIAMLTFVNIGMAASVNQVVKDARELIKEGRSADAEQLIDSAIALNPTEPKLLNIKGEIRFEYGDYAGALENYERAAAAKSKDPDALYGAGMSALMAGEYQKALGYFERGVETKKRKGDFLYGKAFAQMKLGLLAEADATARKAINQEKKNPDFHKLLGDINYEKQVWSIAMSEYRQTLELDSTYTDLYYKLARANFYSRNVNEAVKYYRDYLKANQNDTTAWAELALIYEKSNNPSEAIFCYAKLNELNPENGDYWFAKGDLLFNIRNYEEAAVALEKAVSLGSHVAEAYKRLAKVYQLRQEYFKADSAYSRFEQELGAPDDPEYWSDKGKVMIKIGQKDVSFFDRAAQAFDKAISLDSTNATNWEYGGLARYYKQDYAGAIPYFKKRIELGEENVNAVRNLAFCYLKTEKYDLAAVNLEKAIAIKPDDAIMRQMLGKIYVFTTHIDKAIVHYKAALQDTTGSLSAADKCEVYGDLGYCYLAQREPVDAVLYLERAVKCDPKNAEYLFNLASAYHLDNRLEQANEYYKKVLELDPNHKGAKEGVLRTTTRQ
jgi:tetratricopeptide (TPR) repeat protein